MLYVRRDLRELSRELIIWLTKIAPSCVYPVRLSGQAPFYECSICSSPAKSQSRMIRHYRRKHSREMPADIFGQPTDAKCQACNLAARKRLHHMQRFLESVSIKDQAQLVGEQERKSIYLELILRESHISKTEIITSLIPKIFPCLGLFTD